jgi:hypothetical protein
MRWEKGRAGFVKTDLANIEALIQLTFNLGLEIHRDVGPGLIESVYGSCAMFKDEMQRIANNRHS